MSSSHSFGLANIEIESSVHKNWKGTHAHACAALREFLENALSSSSNVEKGVVRVTFLLLTAVLPEGTDQPASE